MSIKPMKYAFWRHIEFPYVIWGEIVQENLYCIRMKGMTTWYHKDSLLGILEGTS